MNTIEGLVRAYEKFVSLPWDNHLAGPQRVWFALYDPGLERRLRAHIGEFEVATKGAGHGWHQCDVTSLFADWMANEPYRESFFKSPEKVDMVLEEFRDYVASAVNQALEETNGDPNTVLALIGIGSLFGLTRFSQIEEAVAPQITGRLLVFFPGERDGNNYRLLDARDGWNYLAIPITADDH